MRQGIEETTLGEPPVERTLALRRETSDRLVLLLDDGKMFRLQALETPTDLVGGKSGDAAQHFFVDGFGPALAQGEKERTFGPRESDRGRPDRGIPRCLGHGEASGGRIKSFGAAGPRGMTPLQNASTGGATSSGERTVGLQAVAPATGRERWAHGSTAVGWQRAGRVLPVGGRGEVPPPEDWARRAVGPVPARSR